MKHMGSNWKQKCLSFLLVLSLIVPSFCWQFGTPAFAGTETYASLGNKAIVNNYNLFAGGKAVDGGFGNFAPYDLWALKQAGVDLSAWTRSGKSIQALGLELAQESVAKETAGVNCKRLASEYLALSASPTPSTLVEGNKILDVLVARQLSHSNGGFDSGDYSAYANLPAFDYLGRAGKLNLLNREKAIAYVLSTQDAGSKAFPSGYPDFLSTMQGIRTLYYLKTDATPQQLTDINTAIDGAITWTKTTQLENGSFSGSAWDDPLVDTAEAVVTFKLLGTDLSTIKRVEPGAKTPIDYMKTAALNGAVSVAPMVPGTFGALGNATDNSAAIEAYLALGAVNLTTNSVVTVEDLTAHQNIDELGSHALTKQVESFVASGNVTSAYDGYVMTKAGVPLNTLMSGGKSYEDKVIALAKESLDKEKKSNAKRIAGEHLFAKAIKDNVKVGLLGSLTQRQVVGNGPFGTGNPYGIYEYMAAFDYIAEANALSALNSNTAIQYILTEKDLAKKVWPKEDAANFVTIDFMVTNQAVRTLNGLKNTTTDAALKASAQTAIDDAIAWIKTCQQSDGSFVNGAYDDPLVDTVEAIKTFKALGIDVVSVKTSGKSAADYILTQALNSDGTFGTGKNIVDNTAMIEACMLLNNGVFAIVNNGTGGTTGGGGVITPPINPPVIPGDITVTLSIIGQNKESLFNGSVTLNDANTYKKTALGALAKSGVGYVISSNHTDFVTSVGGQANKGMSGWMYKVNGTAPAVLASQSQLLAGDRVEWFYSSSDTTPIGGGGAVVAPVVPVAPVAPGVVVKKAAAIAKEDVVTEGDKLLQDALVVSKGAVPTLSVENLKNGLADVSLKNILTLTNSEVDLKLKNKTASLSMPYEALKTLGTTTGRQPLDQMRIGMTEATSESERSITAAITAADGQLVSIPVKAMEFTAEMVSKNAKGEPVVEKVTAFSEPVLVEWDLSGLTLTPDEIKQLTGVRYLKKDDGSVEAVKLGGQYNPSTKMFSFYTERFSTYGIVKAKSLVQIEVKVGEKAYKVNGNGMTFDQAPLIKDGRTYVPVTAIAKALGGKSSWDAKTKVVTIEVDGKKVTYIFSETGIAKGSLAMISNGRTYVPLADLSETLSARVLWTPSTKSVLVVK